VTLFGADPGDCPPPGVTAPESLEGAKGRGEDSDNDDVATPSGPGDGDVGLGTPDALVVVMLVEGAAFLGVTGAGVAAAITSLATLMA
jgi:hypothetical protein